MDNNTSCIYTDEEGVHEETYSYDRDNLTKYNGEKVDGYKGGNPKTYLGNTLTWARGRQLMSATPTKQKLREKPEAPTVTFTYAYDGSRLSKTVGKTKKDPGTTTEYILNGSTILAQNTTYPSGEKETLNFYYSSDGKLLEIGYLKNPSNDDTKPKDIKETHYSVIRNAMGDVCALYTSDGTLVGTYEYDPYGKLLSETSNPSYTDTEEILHKNPFRYRGYYYDEETKWYYLQSRYYDPQVKRFINADSTDLLTSDCTNLMQYNLFMYCSGDPIKGYDPNGHISWEEIKNWFDNRMEEEHPILFVNMVANSATGANLLGGAQYVVDPIALVADTRHAIGEQIFVGAGVAAGASEKVGFNAGFINAPRMSNLEKTATEIGASAALGPGGGLGMIITGEASEEQHYYGFYIGAYGGASAEGHVNLTETSPTYYPIDYYCTLFEMAEYYITQQR